MENYIYFEEGNENSDIQVISDKGDIKYFPKKIAEDFRLMKDAGYTIVLKPLKVELKEKKQKDVKE